MVQRQAAKKDVFQLFAEKVRDNKDLVSRWAVLQETRVEYFKGKDFVSFLRMHPEVKEILESDRNLETDDIANTLLRKNLLVRCDRVVKTVRPGKKKLSTWPAHLEIFPVCSCIRLILFAIHCFTFRCISCISFFLLHALWLALVSTMDIFFLVVLLHPLNEIFNLHEGEVWWTFACADFLYLGAASGVIFNALLLNDILRSISS